MTHRVHEELAEALAGYLRDRCGVSVQAGDVLAGLDELKLGLTGHGGRQSDPVSERVPGETGWHSPDPSDLIAEIEADEEMDLET